jgi:hypothetical protein
LILPSVIGSPLSLLGMVNKQHFWFHFSILSQTINFLRIYPTVV